MCSELYNLKSVTIPNSVTTIGEGAFEYCSGLTSVTIGSSVTSIEENAFNNCRGLTSIAIPNSVTSIGLFAFQHCTGLTSVTIPESVTSIGYGILTGCDGLKSLTWNVKKCRFDYSGAMGWTLFGQNSGTQPFIISVTFGDDVEEIYEGICSQLSSLKTITIGNSVTSIGDHAFMFCSGLTSVTIPNSVTSIGSGAFSNCSGLTSVTIPNSVTSIGGHAFYGCYALTEIRSKILNVSKVQMGDDVYDKLLHSYCVLKVPIGTANAYRQSAQWKDFKNIIEEESAINDVVEDGDVVVVARDGVLVVEGAGKSPVEVVDMAGRRVYSGAADAIPTLPQGIYIVHVKGKSLKVKI